jgi:RNA polymerase sigma factor (sigma-70 family)
MRETSGGSPRDRSDAELAVQLQAGDPAALGHLYDRHVRGIHDFLVRVTRDPAAAEDLAHSTFLRAWEGRASLRDPAVVRGWLYATAHNLALNRLTRARPTGSLDDEAADGRPDLAPGPEAGEAARLVWAAASSLEASQYAVLDLSVRQELSTREIAEVLDIPPGHAAVLVNRAREALGNAVRYLLVARRRDHCVRLAALVPAGVRALTAQQRSAVDHHMRRCEDCRELGASLTSPAELLGALLPAPLPAALGVEGRNRLVAAVSGLPGSPPPPPAPEPGGSGGPAGAAGPPGRRPWQGRPRWAVGVAALLLLLLAVGGTAACLHGRGAPGIARAGGGVLPGGLGLPGPAAAATPAGTPGASPEAATSPSAPPGPSASPSAGVMAATPSPSPGATAGPGGGTPAPPAPSPPDSTPTPQPSAFAVTGVAVKPEQATCPLAKATQLFVCKFTITVQVVNARGQAVIGTVTATDARTGQTASGQFQVPVPAGSAGGHGPASVSFPTCPMGQTSATTQWPNAVQSAAVPFGAC